MTYYRRAIFLPFLDGLLQELCDRFGGLSAHAMQGLMLIPSNLEKLDTDCQNKLLDYYSRDLLSAGSVLQEIELWKRFWLNNPNKATTLVDTLTACPSNLYPTILQIMMITPVTTATMERGNSSLRYVKNVYRNTMGEDRLNALLLLYVHKDIPLDYNAIVDEYARREPRKMNFINPLA